MKGGYIMTISPTAIGIDVVPTLNCPRNGTMPGTSQPDKTPRAMAAKIQPVKYRSRNPRREAVVVLIALPGRELAFPCCNVRYTIPRSSTGSHRALRGSVQVSHHTSLRRQQDRESPNVLARQVRGRSDTAPCLLRRRP